MAQQKRPIDRPVYLYCRICKRDMPDKGWHHQDGTPCAPAMDITETPCGSCNIRGALVFNEKPSSAIVKWKPHCGNEKCDGTCNDLLCIPPTLDKTIVKIEKPYWFRFLWLGYASGIITGYLIWSH